MMASAQLGMALSLSDAPPAPVSVPTVSRPVAQTVLAQISPKSLAWTSKR
jgi:hypothetical protein